MATWGTVTVGRLTLRETYDVTDQQSAQGVAVEISGQESAPVLTLTQLRQRREDMAGLLGALVPVTFTNKTDRNGYYYVADAQIGTVDWSIAGADQAGYFAWRLSLLYAGPDNSTDLESRLTNLVRLNDFAQTGNRWHAPAIGHHSYYTGTTQPATMTRVTEDGTITVYRSVPANINPRWGCPVGSYPGGRARVKVGGVERSGDNLTTAASGWSMENGLLKIIPGSTGSFTVSTWDSGAYAGKEWNISVGVTGAPEITTWDGFTVLRNDYEAVAIRLDKGLSPGRVLLDLTLRRGSRFVEGYLQSDRSSTLSVWRDSAENGTAPASGGYVTAVSNDADGNKYIVGSARSFTANPTTGGLFKTSAVALDFYIGVVFSGTSAVTGDQAADLQAQYIAAMPEFTMAVRR